MQQWFDKSKRLWQHLWAAFRTSADWNICCLDPRFFFPIVTEILLIFQSPFSSRFPIYGPMFHISLWPWHCKFRFPRPCQCRQSGCCGGVMWSSRAEKHLGREGMVLQHLGPDAAFQEISIIPFPIKCHQIPHGPQNEQI